MYSVEESLSRRSFGRETSTAPGTKKASTRERDGRKRKGSCEVECIQSKDCSEAAIQSAAKSLVLGRERERESHSVGSEIVGLRKGTRKKKREIDSS
jgi:hypothetical protein